MTLSWLTLLEFEPPLVGCVISKRDHSFAAVATSSECVINIPSPELADAVVGCGNTSGTDTDKFATFGLTPLPASQVQAPLIAECFAKLECRVGDPSMVSRYGLFVLEVVRAWIQPDVKNHPTLHHRGHGAFMRAGETIALPSKMK